MDISSGSAPGRTFCLPLQIFISQLTHLSPMRPDYSTWTSTFVERLLDADTYYENRIVTDISKKDYDAPFGSFAATIVDVSQNGKVTINLDGFNDMLAKKGYYKQRSSDGSQLFIDHYSLNTGYMKRWPVAAFKNTLMEKLSTISNLQLPSTFSKFVDINIIPRLPDADSITPSGEISHLIPLYSDGDVIPFSNGVYSIRYNKLLPKTSFVRIENDLAVRFNPEAFDNPVIHQRYLDMMCGDEELFEDLFEQIGYILYARQHNNPHFTMLVGESGSNGKSIILNVLTKIIQSPNIASLSMYEMSNEFQLATACGKYLCMSHDTTNGLRDKSTATADAKEFIKKATAREPFTFNAKYREPFLGYGPSKFIFASNSQINFGGGADNGLERRMTVIPFYAKFKEDQKVAAEFYTPEALEWFAMQALVSYMCYIHRAYEGTDESEFTPNTPLKGVFMKSTKAMLAKKEQMKAQNTLLDWISSYHDCDIDDISTIRRIFTDSYDIYNDYCQFCRLSNRAPMTLNKFNREVKNRYNMQRRRTTRGTDHTYVYEIAGTSPYDYGE